TLYLHPSPHPRLAMQTILSHGITLLPAAPVFFDLLVKFTGTMSQRLPLRAAISVGTALSRRIDEQFARAFGFGIWQSYGTSESGPVALNQRRTPHGELLALGQVCPHVSVEILDERGYPLPDGEIGEIVVRSPAVGLGYDGADGGASTFAAGAFHTGDVGFIRDGELFFAGRKKLLIAAAGHKVDPFEIEQVLRAHPGVCDAAVIGVPDSNGIEQITAYVCARDGLTHSELLAHCAQRLAAYKVPRVIHFRTKLPRNSMGKLLRDQLR
ncbi:MAG: class I adenylate-forming enzyme family protein, partial [Candidatus Sumerlaeaceae bacterium]